MEIIFDIETDGLLDVCTKVHCISLTEVGSGVMCSFTDNYYEPKTGTIEDALDFLTNMTTLIGHNIQAFDIPALQKLYPQFKPTAKIRDTLVMSRLQHVHDMHSHSLAAWGDRLKFPKGDFGKQTDWKFWSVPMQLYCDQDVRLNEKVYQTLMQEKFPLPAIHLEHEFSQVLDWQMKCGVNFNSTKAEELHNELATDEARLSTKLIAVNPFWEKRTIFVPKRNNKTKGYITGVPVERINKVPFNPGSRTQVAKLFTEKFDWTPVDYTDKGNIKVSGDILRDMPYDISKDFADYFDCKKLLGQLATGEKAWLKEVKDGRIHGFINHNGAVTSRCTHSSPNLAQVPRLTGFRGRECRGLFHAPEGFDFVGCDASGLELRNLAHYMAPYDGGRYANIILEGDIHTENQNAAGLPDRDSAKTFIYAHNYGAGDQKLGSIVLPSSLEIEQTVKGKSLRSMFMTKLPALSILLKQVKSTAKARGYLIGLDGRRLYVRSPHVALNVLLQGGGGVLMKWWWKEVWRKSNAEKLGAYPVLHVHDEGQACCPKENSDRLMEIMEETMVEVGEFYNYKIPLEGVAKKGQTWADTH